jgi:hypothetical protein
MADKLILVQARMKTPYVVADASMRAWVHTQFLNNFSVPLRWKYNSETAGSSVHRITDSADRMVIKFILEAIGLQETLITALGVEGQSSEDDLRQILGLFHHGWTVMQEEQMKVEPIEELPNPPHLPNIARAAPRRSGPPTKDYNDWAREEVEAGRDREDVYRGWLDRQGFDSKSPDVRQEHRDAFRKALTRKGRTPPKDGRT